MVICGYGTNRLGSEIHQRSPESFPCISHHGMWFKGVSSWWSRSIKTRPPSTWPPTGGVRGLKNFMPSSCETNRELTEWPLIKWSLPLYVKPWLIKEAWEIIIIHFGDWTSWAHISKSHLFSPIHLFSSMNKTELSSSEEIYSYDYKRIRSPKWIRTKHKPLMNSK